MVFLLWNPTKWNRVVEALVIFLIEKPEVAVLEGQKYNPVKCKDEVHNEKVAFELLSDNTL